MQLPRFTIVIILMTLRVLLAAKKKNANNAAHMLRSCVARVGSTRVVYTSN